MSDHSRARLSSLSLQWRMGALVLPALLVLFGLFGLLGSQLAQDNARAMAAERLSVARLTAQLLDKQFEKQFEELEFIADGLSASEPGLPVGSDLLRPSELLVTTLTLVDGRGRVVWSLPAGDDRVGMDLSNEAFVRAPLDSNERYASAWALPVVTWTRRCPHWAMARCASWRKPSTRCAAACGRSTQTRSASVD